MLAESNSWVLFGIDLSHIGTWLRAAWEQLLWGREAGLRRRIDGAVTLYRESGEVVGQFIAEQAVAGVQRPAEYQALLLPADQVLLRELRLPLAVEGDLDSALALEAAASSPFPADNTCYGWALRGRSGAGLRLVLAICARGDVQAWLTRQVSPAATATNDSEPDPEIWVLDENQQPVVIRGFGEQRRYREYPRRVVLRAAAVACLGLCAVLLLAVPGWVRSMQVQRMEAELSNAQRESAEAVALRETLLANNSRIASIQALLEQQVDYYPLLEHITEQAPNGVYLQRLQLDGHSLRLNGWADNAADYMQLLADDPGYRAVKAATAFSRDGRSGLERFVFEIELSGGGGE